MTFTHHHDRDGMHRIVIYHGSDRLAEGRWTMYQSPATLQFNGRQYLAFTRYFDGLLPSNTVLLVTPQPTDLWEEIR